MAWEGTGMGLTVRELIKKLSELPEHDKDLEVYIGTTDDGGWEKFKPVDRATRHFSGGIIVIRD